MPFSATVLPVMIASPGDVDEYRAHARDVLHEWNYIHSAATNMVLMPVGWETHSSPELGASPQDLINNRVLEECDLLLGIFWTRLGTPTGRAPSGSVEEIQRHVEAGKPAMVYFCSAPAALETVDPTQYAALKDFRTWCEPKGLIESFLNPHEFQSKLRRHLQIVLQKNDHLKSIFHRSTSEAVPSSAQTALQGPGDGAAAIAVTLSPEASALLLAAAEDREGMILVVNALSGRIIHAGGRKFGEIEDKRPMAKWSYGVDQLLNLNLIEWFGGGGEGNKLFQITERGYRIAKHLKRQQR